MSERAASAILRRAIEIAEQYLGVEELCVRLGVPASTIDAWRLGFLAMPDDDFMRLLEIATGLDPDFWARENTTP
jgi:transcriptional regulator with XRE-family HTH domain